MSASSHLVPPSGGQYSFMSLLFLKDSGGLFLSTSVDEKLNGNIALVMLHLLFREAYFCQYAPILEVAVGTEA